MTTNILAQEGGGDLLLSLWIVVLAIAAAAGVRAFRASRQETGEAKTLRSLAPSIRHVVARMDGPSQTSFFNEYERKKKKRSVGWIAWLMLGWHYLYVGKVGVQFAFWLTAGGLGLWWLVDFFRIPSMINSANETMARDAVETLSRGAIFGSGHGSWGSPLVEYEASTPVVEPRLEPPQPPDLSSGESDERGIGEV